MIFDASLNIRDLEGQFHIELPENPAYETLAGFVLTQLGFLPRGGETFEDHGYRFTIMEVEGRRIARVKIKRLEEADTTPALAEKTKNATAVSSPKSAETETKKRASKSTSKAARKPK